MLDYEVTERAGDFVLLELRGELFGQFHTERLRRALEEHYVDDGVKLIRIDLSPVSFLDNHGIATLLALYKESERRGKRFRVEGARGQVMEKLSVTGVLRVLHEGA
jgi:anti-anti-sigma factor